MRNWIGESKQDVPSPDMKAKWGGGGDGRGNKGECPMDVGEGEGVRWRRGEGKVGGGRLAVGARITEGINKVKIVTRLLYKCMLVAEIRAVGS